MTKAELSVKARSPPALLPFKGQITKQKTAIYANRLITDKQIKKTRERV